MAIRMKKDRGIRVADITTAPHKKYPYLVKVDFSSTFIDTHIDMYKTRIQLWLEHNIPLEYDDKGVPNYILNTGLVRFRYEHDRTMMLLMVDGQ